MTVLLAFLLQIDPSALARQAVFSIGTPARHGTLSKASGV
jgi:hypothetical protein